MFSGFTYASIPLAQISLDIKNPRIVTQTPLSSQPEILAYLYENDDLETFVKKIAAEGKNFGAERPYVVKKGAGYVVVEGNTRIAAYKVLTGLMRPPAEYAASVPHISEAAKASLLNVDCSIAPNHDALMPIMASAHFGVGDKSKWGYLGSRKKIFDEWQSGNSIPKLSKLFKVPPAEIRDLILEYQLYLKAIKLNWTKAEKDILLKPGVAFNPPVRFLQTAGHKDKMGISYDTTNLKVVFKGDADKKFKHLLKKLVISPVRGLGATATYAAVFDDYGTKASKTGAGGATKTGGTSSTGTGTSGSGGGGGSSTGSGTGTGSGSSSGGTGTNLKPGALFAYPPTINSGLIKQLMIEAKDINCRKLPAAGTFLLRNIVEAILKHIIDDQKANPAGAMLDIEKSINLCMSNKITLPTTDIRVLKEFQKHHVPYLNLGAHGNVIPNGDRVLGARDCIDQFVKKYV